MRDIVNFWMDGINYLILGILLAYLLHGMLPERFGGERSRIASVGICLQFCLIRQFLAWSKWGRQMMYGKDMLITSSRQSIVPLAVSLAVTLCVGLLLYRGSRMKLLSLVAVFYALLELVRFTFYPIAVGAIDGIFHFYNQWFWNRETPDIKVYQQFVIHVEFWWNLSMIVLDLLFFIVCIRSYKKHLIFGNQTYQSKEAALLFVPGLMGLVFTMMLRCILFYYKKEMFSLIRTYPELNFMIPGMSLLCIASILMSVRMLEKLAREHEKRRQAELYQSRVEGLEAHVQDMEGVYAKLRGMKHDMKNYVADIYALLAQVVAGDQTAKQEALHYVDSIQASLDGLDMRPQTFHPVTDVIVSRYARLAEQKQTAFSSDFLFPKNLGVDVFDISVILNNGLDNALEACAREQEPYIALSARQQGNMFLITIENRFTGRLKWAGGLPVSQKSGSGHGYGLANIRSCVEKYYGRIETKIKGESFVLTVMLQGNMDLMTKNK